MAAPSRYDRQLLLLGPKRNEILDLWEVIRYGKDTYDDPDYTVLYGLLPREWFARGVRLLGRTVVECTRDPLADAIYRVLPAWGSSAARWSSSSRDHNLSLVHLPTAIEQADCFDALQRLTTLVVAFVAPPWGHAVRLVETAQLSLQCPWREFRRAPGQLPIFHAARVVEIVLLERNPQTGLRGLPSLEFVSVSTRRQ